jgi:hypothetical protein
VHPLPEEKMVIKLFVFWHGGAFHFYVNLCPRLELNLHSKLRCMRPTGGQYLSATTCTTFVG